MADTDRNIDLPDSAEAWLARLSSGEAGEREHAAFEAWLARSPGNRAAWERIRFLWDSAPSAADLAAEGVDLTPPRERSASPMLYRIAAAVALAVGLAFVVTDFMERPVPAVYQAGLGERRAVQLDDDTTIELNTDTKIEVTSLRDLREVTLVQGEALFSVSADPERPFLVHTESGATVRVLGTKFNVREEPGRTLVVALEGTVQVYRRQDGGDAPASPLVIRGGQVAECADGRDPVLVDSANIEQLTAWTRGQLVFRDTELADAVDEINRYRQRKIQIVDADLRSLRIGGVFRTDRGHDLVRQLENAGYIRVVESPDGSMYLFSR